MRICVLLLVSQLACGVRLKQRESETAEGKPANGKFSFSKSEKTPKTLGHIVGGLQFAQGCSTKTPSVAVCLAGLSRKFVVPAQIEHIKTALLQPIKNAGVIGLRNSSGADLFIHTKLGAYPTIAEKREQADHNAANTMPNMLEAIKEIGATDFVVEEGWGEAHDRSKLGNPKCFHPHQAVEGGMSYYHDMHGCLEQMRKVEKETGKKYDFVIQSKPDTHEIEGNPANIVNAVQCEKALFVRDAMAYLPRDAFEVYANVWLDQFKNPEPSMCGMKQRQEEFTVNAAVKISQTVCAAQYIR